MTSLVTLTEANFHLRRDQSDDDSYVAMMIEAASAAVINYLKSSTAAFETYDDSNGDPVTVTDSNGDPIVLPAAKAATLMMLAQLYRYRDGDGANYTHGNLPQPVMSILYPLRSPALQ